MINSERPSPRVTAGLACLLTAGALAACGSVGGATDGGEGGGGDGSRSADGSGSDDGGSDGTRDASTSAEAAANDAGAKDASVADVVAHDAWSTDSAAADASAGDGSSAGDSSAPDSSALAEAGADGSTTGFGAATAVAAGQSFCALTASGGVVCWGNNPQGQLGNNTTTTSLVPVQVTGLTSAVTSMSLGLFSACALSGGGLQCWGGNSYGELGNGSMTSSPVPVPVSGLTSGVASVSVGTGSACAVTAGGGVQCWGDNGFGGLGNGSTIESAVPVHVTGLTTGVSSVSVGGMTACAVTTGGGVQCWGNGYSGQLGNNVEGQSTVPVQVSGLTSGVASVSVGDRTVCALTNAGSVLCWGSNQYGTVGNNATTDALVPTAVTGLPSGTTSVSVGADVACALTTGGAVMCWGYGVFGELGNGTTTTSLVPVQVTGLTSGVTSMSAGHFGACAAIACGVQCWGNGPLGDDTTPASDVPVSVDRLGASPCP